MMYAVSRLQHLFLEQSALRAALQARPAWDDAVYIHTRLRAIEAEQRGLTDVDAATTPVGRGTFQQLMQSARLAVERCLELQSEVWESTLEHVVDLNRLHILNESFQLGVFEADHLLTQCLRISARVPSLLQLIATFQQVCAQARLLGGEAASRRNTLKTAIQTTAIADHSCLFRLFTRDCPHSSACTTRGPALTSWTRLRRCSSPFIRYVTLHDTPGERAYMYLSVPPGINLKA